MHKQSNLLKKRTNLIEFVRERDAIMEGINAGLADAKAGRLYTHEEAMARIQEALDRLRKKSG
ncbi:MAG: hypothetical protein JST32_21650, partial [Bacteroidetes bacterium]|nr:hypothetical protein [Bacteroidota bacterium]